MNCVRRDTHKEVEVTVSRSQRTNAEVPVSSKIHAEIHYVIKGKSLEEANQDRVCNSRNIPLDKAVPTLTVQQEFYFHTEEFFQTHPGSYYLAFAQNGIPVFCPGLTDGSLGDMLYFHSFRSPGLAGSPGLVVDIVQDIRAINGEAVHASPQMKLFRGVKSGALPLLSRFIVTQQLLFPC
jgi:hypothetical protein